MSQVPPLPAPFRSMRCQMIVRIWSTCPISLVHHGHTVFIGPMQVIEGYGERLQVGFVGEDGPEDACKLRGRSLSL